FSHRKTAPPIVRLCLTIGMQFIHERSFFHIVISIKKTINAQKKINTIILSQLLCTVHRLLT
ncbi:hypothetical protein OCA10_21895, partial [Bacillus cereus]|nr:hypothetical protein [Bacillus cereus]